MSQHHEEGHTPVLPEKICTLLEVSRGEIVVDVTVGLGGHARFLAQSLGSHGRLIGLDVDPVNLESARTTLNNLSCRVDRVCANFAQLPDVLSSLGLEKVDVILADLGISSPQLDNQERGFSFQGDGPLDMRLDPQLKITAADLINRLKEKDLGDLLFYNAQEFASRRIARQICHERKETRITTTTRLVKIIGDALGVDPLSRKSKIHPATKTFLALRMAVNDEIGALKTLLQSAPDVLNPGGRIGVISFHSVEDKEVKLDFRRRKNEGIYEVLTDKPVVADEEERLANPRSRSAKLRVARKVNEKSSTQSATGKEQKPY